MGEYDEITAEEAHKHNYKGSVDVMTNVDANTSDYQ